MDEDSVVVPGHEHDLRTMHLDGSCDGCGWCPRCDDWRAIEHDTIRDRDVCEECGCAV